MSAFTFHNAAADRKSRRHHLMSSMLRAPPHGLHCLPEPEWGQKGGTTQRGTEAGAEASVLSVREYVWLH